MQQRISTSDRFDSLPSLMERLSAEKAASCGLAILVAYALLRSLVAAASKPFWYDEVLTFIVARQTTVSRIWSALERAVDGQAPGFYLIERLFNSIISNQEVAFRLPLILGFCLTTVCLFLFVRKQSGSAYALACAAIPLTTSLFHFYATEARPYSLVVACVSIALLCYQRAPAPGWMLLFGLIFAVSLTLNYYAVFALVPFALAELALLLSARQFRWSVWLALACGAIPLAFLWPLLAQNKKYYGSLPFAKPTLSAIVHIYGSIFGTSPPWGVAIVAVMSLFLFGIIAFRKGKETGTESLTNTSLHETVLVLALLALPVICYLLARILHAGMSERYVLSTALGVPLAVAHILPRLARRGLFVAVGFLISLLAMQEAIFWKAHAGRLTRFESPAVSVESLVGSAGYADMPVVVSDGGDYLPIAHYATPAMAKRLVCLVDVPASLVYAADDVMDKELIVLRPFAPLQIWDFVDFASQHHAFLLYSSNGSGGDPHDWWAARLLRDGYTLRVVAADHRQSVFLVRKPGENSWSRPEQD
jgi:4-amino-4-deoxy-L-arabinose transferase-like glycosyltransferase